MLPAVAMVLKTALDALLKTRSRSRGTRQTSRRAEDAEAERPQRIELSATEDETPLPILSIGPSAI
jgi:hypothetical protein